MALVMTRRSWLTGMVAALAGPAHGAEPDYTVANVYSRLRAQALKLQPSDLRRADPSAGAFGVLMETGYPDAVATLVALADGTASLYFSNGGGIIGAGDQPAVAKAAREAISTASRSLTLLAPAAQHPLPRRGHVRFYVLTGRGPLTAEARESELRDRRLGLSPLFAAAHELIAAIRQHHLKRTQ